MAIVIRDATLDDAPALNALVTTVARERRYLGSTEGFTLEQTLGYLSRLQEGNEVSLVAEDDGRIVGWVDVTRGPFEGLTHCGRLGMGVAPDARGMGVGTALLVRALDRGFRTLERIELEVFASNVRACDLYRRMGFVDEGRRRGARKLDGAYDDILMMGMLRGEWRPAENK